MTAPLRSRNFGISPLLCTAVVALQRAMSVSKAAASLSTIIVVVIVASVAFFVAARPRETLHDALYNCAAALKPGSKPE